MRTFLLSYDLAASSDRKSGVVDAIMTLGLSWARPLENVWYVRTDAESGEIEARLRETIDVEDGLLIQAVRDEAVMLNTGLRWFRQRRKNGAAAVTTVADNVVAFPTVMPANDLGRPVEVRAAS